MPSPMRWRRRWWWTFKQDYDNGNYDHHHRGEL